MSGNPTNRELTESFCYGVRRSQCQLLFSDSDYEDLLSLSEWLILAQR